MTGKNQFDAMADYFRSMLTPVGSGKSGQGGSGGLQDPAVKTARETAHTEARPVLEKEQSELSRVARLIEQVTPEPVTVVKTAEPVVQTATENKVQVSVQTDVKTETAAVQTTADELKTDTAVQEQIIQEVKPDDGVWRNIDVPEEFQALFFIVHGVTFAVPLINLGNIANMDKVTSIFGKPEWFMGMMNFRDEKYKVVDFVKWAMPNVEDYEKNFSYVIEMENSRWAITCNELIGTESLCKSQIQWRSTAGKRPWLSGLVKEKMCALIHVNELIKLFNQGINIEGDKS